MRVLLSSTRGAGHLTPLISYAHALLRHGHEVLVAAPQSVGTALAEANLPHAPFDHPGDDRLAPIWARLRAAPPEESLRIAVSEIFAGLNARCALPNLRDTIRSWQPDLVLRESAEFGALVAAKEAGVRHARIAVHMVSFEGELFGGAAVASIDLLLVESGLAAGAGEALRAEPTFTAFPASLDQVESHVRVFRARPPLAPRGEGHATPAWVPVDRAQPFLYVTFGTIAGGSPEQRAVYRSALDAVANMPVRALLTTGPGMDAAALGPIPDNVAIAAFVPQADVLPFATALVCHGGSGTMLGGLEAGVPLVIAPMFADQPHNARRVEAVGAGVAVTTPDAASLRAAIDRVLKDDGMRRTAARIAHEMAEMPPMEAAVENLARLAAG